MTKTRKEIGDEIIDNLLKDYKDPEDLVGESGLLAQLTKRVIERVMSAELTEHVGYEKHDPEGATAGIRETEHLRRRSRGRLGLCR